MQRWQGAALAVVLLGGCLDSMVGDTPGYSRYILPPGATPPLAMDDSTLNRKIDTADGVAKPSVMPKKGWVGGAQVSYWDFGAGKRGTTSAYGLQRCVPDGTSPVDHPLIVDSIPGDSDYSPFRAVLYACVTAKYANEVLASLDAFNDAIDLGLITDPTATTAAYWINQPISTSDVALAGGVEGQTRVAFYRGQAVTYHSMERQEGQFPVDGMPVPAPNVYEIVKPGSTVPVRIIFSQPFSLESGGRNPKYSPNWTQVTVTLREPADSAETPLDDLAKVNAYYDAKIATLTKESDLVTVGMNNALTIVDRRTVLSVTATTNRVNRPFVIVPGAM
jgi:hypothetical protein